MLVTSMKNLRVIIVAFLILILGILFLVTNFNSTDIPVSLDSSSEDKLLIESPAELSNQDNEFSPVQENPRIYQVSIEDYMFNPTPLKINIGDTIIWTNKDPVSHTVTSDSGAELDSSRLSKGQTYSHTFLSTGTYDYHCVPHRAMKGQVIVSSKNSKYPSFS